MVKPKLELYLTDLFDAAFAGENAKNREFRGGEILSNARIYHAGIKHNTGATKLSVGQSHPGIRYWTTTSSRKPLAAIRDLATNRSRSMLRDPG